MTTAASRLAGHAPVDGHIRLGAARIDADSNILALVEEGWSVKQKLDAAKDRLHQINEKITLLCLPMFDGAGVMHIVTSKAVCSITRKDRVEIADLEALRRILGRRFPDLVRERVSYAPERKLIALAEDDHAPLAQEIRTCLSVRKAEPSLAYKAS